MGCIWCLSAGTGRSQRVSNAICEHRAVIRALICSPGSGFSGWPAAADVGVGGPVSGGGVLPGDGGADVEAGHAGEDGGVELGGELEERGGWCLPGADADVLESLAEVAGADGPAGPAAGGLERDEEPGEPVACADDVVVQARAVALAECGTHAFLAAEAGPYAAGEKTVASRLYPRLNPGELLTADRNFLLPRGAGAGRRDRGRAAVAGPDPARAAGDRRPARRQLPERPGQPWHPPGPPGSGHRGRPRRAGHRPR
jgi:hypothetical protein